MSADDFATVPDYSQTTFGEPAPPAPARPGPGFWAALGWTFLLAFALNVLSTGLFVVYMAWGIDLDDAIGVLFLCTTLATTSLAILISVLHFGHSTARRLGICLPAVGHVALVLLTIGPLAVVVQEIAAWAAEVLPSILDGQYSAFALQPWPLILFGGCVFPALGEEIFFRGFLGRGLLARLGVWWGMLWTSVLFALIHIDPPQVIGIVFVGLALHLIFLATRSLWMPILLHFCNNALSFTLERAEIYSLDEHLPPLVVLCGAAALVPLAVLFWQSRANWILPDGERWTPGYATTEVPPPEAQARRVIARPGLVWLLLAAVGQIGFWTMFVRSA